VLDLKGKKQNEHNVAAISSLKKGIEIANYSNLKEKGLLTLVRLLERRIAKKDETYKSESKTRKRLRLVLALLIVVGCAIIIDQTFLNILPSWTINFCGYIFIVILMISMLIDPSDRNCN